MNEQEIAEVLGRLKGEADAPSHRQALRRALLSTPEPRSMFAALPQLITSTMTKKYYIPLAAIALVAIGAATFNAGDPAVAQAQEQAKRAFTRAIAISPEMRAELEARMKADMLETLKEAMAAPDLRILTKEEFEKESPFSFSTGPVPAVPAQAIGEFKAVRMNAEPTWTSGGSITVDHVAGERVDVGGEDIAFTVSAEAMKQGDKGNVAVSGVVSAGMMSANGFSEPVKYLSYTDPKGHKTVLGLDKDDTPVFKISTLNAEDVMHFEDGSVGIQGKAVQMIKLKNAGAAEKVEN